MDDELVWDPPGPGDWWLVREHFPFPVCGLFASLFPPVTVGWRIGAARYGLSTGTAQWAAVNGWIYYGPPVPLTAEELAERDAVAAATLGGATPWRDEVRRWHDEERPAAVVANRTLQAVDVAALDDVALSAHLQRTIENFRRWAPIHFEHTGFDIAAGILLQACRVWGIEGHEVIELLAGGSPASAGVDTHLLAIADALDAAGAPDPVGSIDEIRAAGPSCADAFDAFFEEYRFRGVSGQELLEPTLGERPDLVLAALATRRDPARRGDRSSVNAAATAVLRSQVPDADRTRFDELLADARSTYGLREDDAGVCWNWPLGLVRHAGLEIGRRLAGDGVVEQPDDVFEAVVDELPSLLAGRGPAPDELAARRRIRERARTDRPPVHLAGGGEVGPDPARPANVLALEALREPVWSVAPPRVDAPLHGVGIGSGVVVGPARLVVEPDDIWSVTDGDVLVATSTTASFNAVFPLLAGVVTEQGSVLSHAAIVARELGTPAVVGVGDVFAHVRPGDIVELDETVGSVRVVDRPGASS